MDRDGDRHHLEISAIPRLSGYSTPVWDGCTTCFTSVIRKRAVHKLRTSRYSVHKLLKQHVLPSVELVRFSGGSATTASLGLRASTSGRSHRAHLRKRPRSAGEARDEWLPSHGELPNKSWWFLKMGGTSEMVSLLLEMISG